jgi:hypothetical protein
MSQNRTLLISTLALTSLGAILSAGETLSAQTSGNTAAPEEKQKQELLELENLWLKSEEDPAALESILAPDFLHVVGSGTITKDEQLEYMRKHRAPHSDEQKHFENMRVRVYGTVGIVNGEVVASAKDIRRRTLFTDVFAYRNGKWQAISAQELPRKTP